MTQIELHISMHPAWYQEPIQKIEASQKWYEHEQTRCKRLAAAAKRGGEPAKKAAKKGA